MSNDLASAVLMTAVGGVIAVHCSRSALREYRASEGRARRETYRRNEDPLRFWAVIAFTALAAVFGLLSCVLGIVALVQGHLG